MKFYRLMDDHSVVEVPESFCQGMSGVQYDQIGDCIVSTIFLGQDHNWSNVGPPILFETMVKMSDTWTEQERCSTYDEAIAIHLKFVANVRKHLGLDKAEVESELRPKPKRKVRIE